MQTLLQIKASLFSDDGESSRLANRFVAAWRAAATHRRVIVRDLAREPVPHLDAERDTQTQYLRHVLGFIGIRDVGFVFAEGLALGLARKGQAVAKATAQAEALALPALVATA